MKLSVARIVRVLNRHPRAKYALYRAVDAGIACAARCGLDIRRRRTAFTRTRHRSIGLPLEWLPARNSTARATHWIEVDPPHDVVVRGPTAYSDVEDSPYSALWHMVTRGYTLNACDILELRDGRFHLPSGLVAAGGRFPSETISLDGFPYRWQYVDCMRTLWAPSRRMADGFLLTLHQSANYYHWVCEVLPLAYALMRDARWGTLPVYVSADLPEFVFEYLRMLGLEGYCRALPHGVYSADTLLVPTFPGGSEWPSPDHLCTVRRACLEAVGPSLQARRRLYISRADAAERRVVNETELMATLADLGFERVTLTGMSPADQIRLFQTADIVLAPHGAGTTNILFAPPDCLLIELMGPGFVSTCFMVVASAVGQRYGYVRCDERDRDLVVDTAAARRVVDDLIRARCTPPARPYQPS
jgi:hypothetical protein